MDLKLRNLLIVIFIALVVVAILLYFLGSGDSKVVQGKLSLKELAIKTECLLPTDDMLGDFAKCLGQKSAVFYGASWCSHCQDQKKLFGEFAKDLPYVECSDAGGNEQLKICADQNITVYPTWKFK